jgi:hypothetical protein
LIHVDRLSWESAVSVLRWRMGKTKGDDQGVISLLNEALVRATQEASRHPISNIHRDPHIAGW